MHQDIALNSHQTLFPLVRVGSGTRLRGSLKGVSVERGTCLHILTDMAITVEELEERYQIPQGFLDDTFTDEHAREFALSVDSWELLASHLDLSEQQIEAIKIDNESQEVKRLKVLTSGNKSLLTVQPTEDYWRCC